MAGAFDVRIQLKHGQDLPIGDITSSDPYVEIAVRGFPGLQKYKSFVKHDTLDPCWDETITYLGLKQGTTIEFLVKDKDFGVTRDSALGQFELSINPQEFQLNVPTTVEKQVGRKGHVELEVTLSKSCHGGAPTVTWPARCRTHISQLSGVVTQNSSGFATRELFLHSILEVMGPEKQHWNTKYPTAQKIFNSPVAVGVIRTEHAGLYRNAAEDDTTTMESAEDFFKLLNYGYRDGEARYYTYALVEDAMRFSETGAAFFKDILSKHALHASAAEEVVYAGEFCIIENSHGRGHTLVIDNNSGTYAPNGALLPKLERLLKANFPGMSVETVDSLKNKPRLDELHRRCPSRMKA